MRDQIYKFMPIALGVFIGWLMFNPPAFLEALGPLRWLVNAALCAALLLSVVALVVVTNLPARLVVQEMSESEVPASMRPPARRLEELGFVAAGPPLRVMVSPSATMLGFVHEKEPVYATVFRTGTVPAKTSSDFVSILYGEKGGLTTNADPSGAVLPEGSESLRQVFPGADPEALFSKHVEAVRFLGARGLPVREVSAGTFREDLSFAIARQRAIFLEAPLRNTLLTLWRAATKKVPFVGALSTQQVASRQIERLLAG